MFKKSSGDTEINKEKRLIIILSCILCAIVLLFAMNAFGVDIIDNLQAERAARNERIEQQKEEKAEQMRMEEEKKAEQLRLEEEEKQQNRAKEEAEQAEKLEEERINQLVRDRVNEVLMDIETTDEDLLKIKIKAANQQLAIEAVNDIETNTEYQKWFKDTLLSSNVELSKITIAQYLTTSSKPIYLKYNNDVETTYDIVNLDIILNEKFERKIMFLNSMSKDLIGKTAIMCKSTYVIEVPEQFKNEWSTGTDEKNPCGIFAIIILDD